MLSGFAAPNYPTRRAADRASAWATHCGALRPTGSTSNSPSSRMALAWAMPGVVVKPFHRGEERRMRLDQGERR